MKLRLEIIPDEIIQQYNLLDIAVDKWIYCEIKKEMYGLPHTRKFSNERLTKHLDPYGYTLSKLTPGMWKHATRSITFTLVVDNFGIKFINPVNLTHLLDALKEQYDITHDKTGALYCGITLE